MKAVLLCMLVLAATAVEFETFQEALNFDPESLGAPNCGNDDSFTESYESFFPWIQLIEEGEVEMQEDHSVLTQARDKIKEAREYIQDLDEDIEQEHANAKLTEDEPAEPVEQPEPSEPEEPTVPEVQPEQDEDDDDDDEDDDPFGWGQGEVPQMLIHSHKKQNKKNNGHAKVLLEVMNGSKSLKFKSKIRKIIAMAATLDTNMGTANLKDRKHRKLELCDLILEELENMIEFLEKVMNDIDYQVEALDIFRKKQEQIVEVAGNCGARVMSLQDTYSVSFVQTQPLVNNHKKQQKRKNRMMHK